MAPRNRPARSSTALRELNGLRVMVLLPQDAESRLLMSHLKRIGCVPTQQWPLPERLGADADVVVLPIEEDQREAIQQLADSLTELSPPLVGIVEYENPATLQLVLQSGCTGVIERPIRPFGLLTQLLLARTAWRQQAATLAHVRKLEGRYAAASKVATAKTLLIAREGITEHEAHRRIQSRAMATRSSLEDVAQILINELS
ncbi:MULTISPECIES: ANTAR domain-containing response regulator [Achromobacter]|uniref:ANTAR domain-containing protein n=1 Tax=Achromobacter spanius TaxID=217203 RepID=A0ABY8H376_9BURK|nr:MULTISPECIES: ANTAR domain-containing protein [Achromobacter]WAI86260.1 ANTAR domain-containing protein [Achromobacter spanius]WEX97516.1 ANTAR domain-containing protein [Achromobacter sp. SS2-2022]WFP11184.1 ANTAR domain-containing protein [Achromobacter spanius]